MKSLSLTIVLLSSLLVVGKTVDELALAYQAKVEDLNSKRLASIENLDRGYLRRLGTLKKDVQKTGKLEAVEPIEQEIEKIKAQTWPLDPLPREIASSVKKARKLYSETRFKMEKANAEKVVDLADRMLDFLDKKKISATQVGELQEAKAARDLILSLEADATVAAARALAKISNLAAGGPAAFQIRRYGDHLEVLIHYDANGKVSLKSPVSNVIETTDGRRERGNTTAKTLGEFIGAPGYQVHPYIAFDHSFSSKKPPEGIGSGDFECKYGVPIADRNALRLELSANPKNPNFSIANIFPPNDAAGRYRVICSYYIPQENRNFTGFSIHQNFGEKVGNHIFEKKNQWVSKAVEADSYSTKPTLRIYPKFRAGQTIASGAGEAIYIESLLIEHIRFSAFIHSRFDENGELLNTFTKSADQNIFASNGKIVTQ